ncbi:signal recognition particle protein Srp54 [Candidatus Woesearchaeota archaeon]|nr:signal recognition particle protein Srp54 [Candidatus Woesearchaeota archaeon]MBW3017731.1 signal recognition particle protein Srp54 [Candidatus Woesearchaeota archaeon]
MVLEKLGSSLKNTLAKITKAVIVDKKLVEELVKEIQRALLQADVNVELVFKLTSDIKKRALDEEIPVGLTKKEHLVNIVYEELVKFLGEEEAAIDTSKKPTKIMLVGLFGNGKTTTAGKLAKYFQKRGKKVAVMQTDTWRPAAYEQLQQLAKQINADFLGVKGEKDPVKIYKKFEPQLAKYDIVIFDTAGRDKLSDELIKELNDIHKLIQADEKLLVIGADVGQGAQEQAQTFHDTCNVTGVIITKLDGTAKGGGALSACSITNAPVKFIGVGEKIDDLEHFVPERFVSRMLGMGDIEGLLEKAREAMDVDQAEDLGKRFLKGEFNLIDLYEQMQAMKKMGPLGKVMDLIPGMGKMKIPKELIDTQEANIKKWKFIMDSCTKEELEDPDIISAERVDRIAKGSGTEVSEVRGMLKQYRQAKKMMKMFKGGGNRKMKQALKQFGGKLPDDLSQLGSLGKL